MKKVTCYVDFKDTHVGRTAAFNKLCLLLMLLRVWDVTELKDIETGAVKTWFIDRTKADGARKLHYSKV